MVTSFVPALQPPFPKQQWEDVTKFAFFLFFFCHLGEAQPCSAPPLQWKGAMFGLTLNFALIWEYRANGIKWAKGHQISKMSKGVGSDHYRARDEKRKFIHLLPLMNKWENWVFVASNLLPLNLTVWGIQTDLTCSRHTRTDWHLTWLKSWCLTLIPCGLSLWALHKQAGILLFPKEFYPSGLLCAPGAAAQAPGCQPSLCAHVTGLVPSITQCHLATPGEWCLHAMDVVTNLDCILCSSAFSLQGQNPFLLALCTRQPSLTKMGFPTGTNRCKAKAVFCYLHCKKFFIFLAFLPSPRIENIYQAVFQSTSIH